MGVRQLFGKLTLAQKFLLASFLILLAQMAAVGWWVGREIEGGVLNRTASITALYVDSVLAAYLQPLATQPRLGDSDVAALDRLLAETALGEQIVAFKVWSPEGEVLFSPNRALIGRRFPVKTELSRALAGEVVADLSDLSTPENEYERQRWGRLLEVYVPVRERGSGRLLGVTEFYQLPDELEGDVSTARLHSWAVVAEATLVSYLLLAGIVRRGSDTIARQQVALSAQVEQLSCLLAENQHLGERVRRAAGRAAELNERFLRRVSAELHDGPAQDLSLALLRLDHLPARCAACPTPAGNGTGDDELEVIRGSLAHALQEIRAISSGLGVPQLASTTLGEVAARVVRAHERRTGSAVAVQLDDLPKAAPLSTKIALYRVIQEGLTNAYRHAGGAGQRVSVRVLGDLLRVEIADGGPGFDLAGLADADEGIGLIGMRERVESLGGRFQVESRPGQGTRVLAELPLTGSEAEDER